MSLLSGKQILITGGSSRLGSAFVKKAKEEGAKVFFTFLKNSEEAQKLEKLGAKGFELDLSQSEKILQFAKDFKANVKALDVLIHNAALVRDHTIQNLTDEDWDEVLSVNLKAPYLLTKELLFLLFRRGKTPEGEKASPRKIFMVTSRVAAQGGFGVANYAASKAGLTALAKSLAQELGKKQILVNAVNPGFMKSHMTEALPEKVIEANVAASPIEKISNPEEVADFLVYLCSDKMTQVTGQTFHFESRKTNI